MQRNADMYIAVVGVFAGLWSSVGIFDGHSPSRLARGCWRLFAPSLSPRVVAAATAAVLFVRIKSSVAVRWWLEFGADRIPFVRAFWLSEHELRRCSYIVRLSHLCRLTFLFQRHHDHLEEKTPSYGSAEPPPVASTCILGLTLLLMC